MIAAKSHLRSCSSLVIRWSPAQDKFAKLRRPAGLPVKGGAT
jgi:hypothetical protein